MLVNLPVKAESESDDYFAPLRRLETFFKYRCCLNNDCTTITFATKPSRRVTRNVAFLSRALQHRGPALR